MTGTTARMALVVLGLLLVLTYLLFRGTTPDAELHERRLRAIDALTFNEAALHRDVLKASHGLLLDYDPLVATVERLREVATELRNAGALRPLIDGIAAQLDRQEALVEDFKSAHALLRNSLSYFSYLSEKLVTAGSDRDRPVALVVGRLASAMFRFVGSASNDAKAAAVAAALDELAAQAVPDDLHEDTAALRAHGVLILQNHPLVGGILARLLETRVSEQANSLQDHFMEQQRHAESRAWIFRVLLYLASVLLLAYLGLLYVRLRAQARALKARSDFEHLIAGISGQLIDTPVDRTAAAIRQALERLGQHVGVDRAYVILHGTDRAKEATSYSWFRAGIDVPDGWPDGGLTTGCEHPLPPKGEMIWNSKGHERYGCVDVPSVAALPRSDVKARLTECGILSWLCVPLWHAGNSVGLLGFDAVASEKRWTDDDIALLRTVGEILVDALFREQAERDRQALEARLRHAQRMESLGTLAGGIAHDFNNILGAILGYAEMLLGRLRRESREWQHVQEVKKAGERARDIVDRILAFSRRTEQRLRPLRMRSLLEETAGLLRAALPPTIALRLRLPDEHAPDGDAIALGEPERVQQVVMNLCTNAAHAMTGHGIIDVALEPVALDTEQVLSHGALAAGRYVRLSVRDSGHGMDAATLDRIFEPFFTTKEAGVGTGLGLAMVHGIVADHGGAIDVHSRPGAGSSFEVYFRQAKDPPADDDRTDAPLPIGRGETILIVDDEKPLVQLGEEMVAALGYEPIGFDDSTRALAAFRADPQRFDLVLADEIMPGMTGTQLAAALHAIRPDLPILLMTGFGGAVESAPTDACEILKKPLLPTDIASAIARHLHPEHQSAKASWVGRSLETVRNRA
jgi:signal transduction histidine kinase/ActR/RegA family two-component response regulator